MSIKYERVNVLGKDMFKASAENVHNGIYMSLYVPWQEIQENFALIKFKENAKREFKNFF